MSDNLKNMSSWRLFIPTRDSERHILLFLKKYRDLGLEPLYIVDSRTKDQTRELLFSNEAKFIEYEPTGDYPEAGMIEHGAMSCKSDWVLRLDDDEFLSKSLVDWINGVGVNSSNQLWKISRREIFRLNDKFYYNRSIARYDDPSNPFF